MTAWAAASAESKRSCAISGAAHAIASAVQMVPSLAVMVLSPPSSAAHPPASATAHPASAAAHPASAESAGGASRPHAGEAMIAFHARHPTVVITAEYTVIARPAALLEARASEALLRRGLPAIRVPGRSAEPVGRAPERTIICKPAGYLAVGIRDAEPVFRIVRPQPPCPSLLRDRGNAGSRSDERKNGR